MPERTGNPFIDFFSDHTSSDADFRDSLVSLGMPDADVRYFEDGIAGGATLVTVKADARVTEALEILEGAGADTGRAPGADDTTLELRAERLSVGKVRVASGAVRIRKDVITERQSFDVPVSHEELVIERHPVSDPNAAAGGTIGATETYTIALAREEVSVRKQTFVTEEIDIGKRAVMETAHVSETVRHEELIVDTHDLARPPL